MSAAALSTAYEPYLFPGDILLIRDINALRLFVPSPPLCRIGRADRVRGNRPGIEFSPDKNFMVQLTKDAHDWLMERDWQYEITICPRNVSIILELGEASRAVMFKLTLGGDC